MTNNPCYKCNQRHVNCRSECESYKRWTLLYDEEAARIRKIKHDNQDIKGLRIESIQSSTRKKARQL